MLVLSRYRDEVIVIGEDGPDQIRIAVVDIRGDKVRLGIEAPVSVPVNRLEVHEAINRERRLGIVPRGKIERRSQEDLT